MGTVPHGFRCAVPPPPPHCTPRFEFSVITLYDLSSAIGDSQMYYLLEDAAVAHIEGDMSSQKSPAFSRSRPFFVDLANSIQKKKSWSANYI